MIFRLKRHWWSALAATAAMLLIAWPLGGIDSLLGRLPSLPVAVAIGVSAGVGCGIVNWLMHQLVFWLRGADYTRRFHAFAADVIGRMGLAEAITGGVMAGLAEEPLFRGVLLPLCGPPAVGIVVSAVIFGIAHFLRWEYFGFFLWGIGEGLAFGTLFVVTGSIVVPAVAHGLFDIVGFLYFERLRDRGLLKR
jgi:membrane protease YdiL (CAAX protease family)